MSITLYGANLFGRAYKEAQVRHLNNAPGGAGGIDGRAGAASELSAMPGTKRIVFSKSAVSGADGAAGWGRRPGGSG